MVSAPPSVCGSRLEYHLSCWSKKRGPLQHDLACSYRDGNGVPQDYVQAHMWYSLSVSQSSEAEWANRAKNRDLTAQRMTPDQIAEAQRLATEWDAAHPREP